MALGWPRVLPIYFTDAGDRQEGSHHSKRIPPSKMGSRKQTYSPIHAHVVGPVHKGPQAAIPATPHLVTATPWRELVFVFPALWVGKSQMIL